MVDPDVEEMITLFQVNGAMIYCDPDGRCTGYDDVFTRIDKCRRHYAANGLGEGGPELDRAVGCSARLEPPSSFTAAEQGSKRIGRPMARSEACGG